MQLILDNLKEELPRIEGCLLLKKGLRFINGLKPYVASFAEITKPFYEVVANVGR